MSISSPYFIFFYCLAGVSTVLSVCVIVSLFKLGASTTSSKLIVFLHIAQVLEDISTLPYVYDNNSALCQTFGFLHVYSVMSSVMVVFLMVLVYRYLFIDDTFGTSQKVKDFMAVLCFAFPLICLLPFSTASYGVYKNHWCELTDWIWLSVLYFGITFVLIFASIVILLETIWRVAKADKEMAGKLVKTIGTYAGVSLLIWIPRSLTEANRLDKRYANLLVFATGILYFAIFTQEKKALKVFELQTKAEFNMDGSSSIVVPEDYFSWDGDEMEREKSRSESAAVAHESFLKSFMMTMSPLSRESILSKDSKH